MAYIDNTLTFSDTRIVEDTTGIEIMLADDARIMEKSTEYICQSKGDILELGFGMGISADYVQAQGVNSHTIVEIHPQVIERLKTWAEGKSNVTIVEGDWETVSLGTYDGIFIDPYDPVDGTDFRNIKQYTIDRAKDGAKMTYWNIQNDNNLYNFDNISFETVSLDGLYEDAIPHLWYDSYYMPKVVM